VYDTVHAYLILSQPLDRSCFVDWTVYERKNVVTHRGYLPRVSDRYSPNVVYKHSDDARDFGVLSVEFSVARMAGCSPVENVSDIQRDIALDNVNKFLFDKLQLRSDMRTWTVTRIDYSYNVLAEVQNYLAVVGQLQLSGYQRVQFSPLEGVVWKSASRWIKFYDKLRQMGHKQHGEVLRYEVSNMRRSVQYMCKHWFGCERTVGELLHRGRALYTLARVWQSLGLDKQHVYDHHQDIRFALRDAYHASASTALYVLNLIRDYGTEAIKLNLISSNAYYDWRRKLIDDGFLITSDEHQLSALQLPIHQFIAQNVDVASAGWPTSFKKISGIFGVTDGAPSIRV